MLKADPRDKARLIDPLFAPLGRGFLFTVAGLLAIIAFGGYMYARQFVLGLGETGMDRPTYWGIYMVNFIFLIGVSMAGTLISASLQLTQAEWRRPLTRVAESLTVFGLSVAAMQILFDTGRPDRMVFVVQYGRLQSPLLWDATSLSLYLLASIVALYLELLPDIAILRDNIPDTQPLWRRLLYRWLALGWRGNRTQWLRLEQATTVLAILIIPIGVSLHTVTSWIFSTTVQPGWKSTIFGPYFVIGAIFSGIGLLFILMTIVRRAFKLDEYITQTQYRNLGWLFIVMNAVWFYFTYTEHLTLAAEQEVNEFPLMASKLWGADAATFWGMVLLMTVAFWLMVVPKLLPERAGGLLLFQPRFALLPLAAAGVLGVALVRPLWLPFPVQMDLVQQTFGWIALIGLLVLAALSVSLWFKPRTTLTPVLAGASVVVGMWLERWNIIIPTMTHPYLVRWNSYTPTITEWALTAGSFALVAFMFVVFYKLFPVVSIWEVSEGRVVEAATSTVVIPPPQPMESPTKRLRRWGLRK